VFDLLDEMRQWLDFTMWFIIEHRGSSVSYEWFVKECPRGSCPGNPGVTESATERVLDLSFFYGVDKPFRWVVRTAFERGAVKRVGKQEFVGWMRGELVSLNDCLARQVFDLRKTLPSMETLPAWCRRRDLFPRGSTLAELHSDYQQVREHVLSYYNDVETTTGVKPPFFFFPEPVPLPAKAQTPVARDGFRASSGQKDRSAHVHLEVPLGMAVLILNGLELERSEPNPPEIRWHFSYLSKAAAKKPGERGYLCTKKDGRNRLVELQELLRFAGERRERMDARKLRNQTTQQDLRRRLAEIGQEKAGS
jgi:hypothetical protein